jgi:hypothetical protein
MKEYKYSNITLLIAFATLTTIGIFHHELWLDEAHHWLFARDSHSVKELLTNMRYDGHPILWNFLLFLITRATTNIISMQILNLCISISAAALFLYYAPFTRVEKTLFIFGYYMLFEYTIISRNYMLLIFFLFLSLIMYDKQKYLLLGLILGILANTHLFGLAFATFFTGMLMMEFVIDKRRINHSMILGLLLLAICIVISLVQIIPPTNSNLYTNADKSPALERAARTSAVFLKALLPIIDFRNEQFWNSNLLMSFSKPFCSLLSFILFCIPFILFRHRITLILFFYSSALFIMLFVYLSDLNAVRYYGAVYLVWISVFWLDRSSPIKQVPSVLKWLSLKHDYSKVFFASLLVVQLTAGIIAYTKGLNTPFSGSKKAAELILKNNKIKDYLSAGCGASPVSAYLGKKVFYLNTQTYGSFCQFNVSANEEESKIKPDAIDFVKRNNRSAFLISHVKLTLTKKEALYISLSGAFEKSALKNENYYLYLVSNGE